MSEECEKGFSCAKFYEARLDALEKLFELQLREIDNKTQLAKESMELRLAAMNEFRETLRDQASKLMGRDEYVTEMKSIHGELQTMRDWMVSTKAMATQKSMYVTLFVALAGLAVSIWALLIHTR